MLRYFIPVYLYFVYAKSASVSSPCNPVYCYSILDSLFDTDADGACLKSQKLIECVNQCFPNPSIHIIEGFKVLKRNLCSESYKDDFVNVNKCLYKQQYDIYSCVYEHYNKEADDPTVNPTFLNCKRSFDVGICSELNSPCTARALYLSKSILEEMFNAISFEQCAGINFQQISFQWKAFNSKKYVNLGDCLDKNRFFVLHCLTKSISDVPSNSQSDLCRTFNSFVDCVKNIVQNNCSDSESTFVYISNSLRRNVMPDCLWNGEATESLTKKEFLKETSSYSNNLAPINYPEHSSEHSKLPEISKYPSINDLDIPNELYTEKISKVEENSNSEFQTSQEHKNIFQNLTKFTLNNKTQILPLSNSSDPIIIEKHVFITVSYRAKNYSNNFSVCYNLIGLLMLLQYLYFHFKK